MNLSEMFTINTKNVVEVNPALLNYDSFKLHYKECIKKNGLKDNIYNKEVAFIYFYCNREYYAGYNDKHRVNVIKERVKLSATWSVGTAMQVCINELLVDTETITFKTVNSIKKQLHNYTILLDVISDKNNVALLTVQSIDADVMDVASMNALKIITDTVEANLSKVFDIVSKLPKALNEIETIEAKLRKESSSDRAIGGRKTNKWEKD